MIIDDGGSAFPIPFSDKPGAYSPEPGMSLRDWFAGQAIQGIWQTLENGGDYHELSMVAHDAYDLADAMLTVRKRSLERTTEE